MKIKRCIKCKKIIEEHDLFKILYNENEIKVIEHYNCDNPKDNPIKEFD